MARPLESSPVGLSKAVIEEAPASAIDIGHYAVEYLTSLLVLVKSVVQIRPMETPGL